ncbi:MAG: hypothetical protein V8S08_02245 [Lachnoclostridium sp.]
MALLSDYIHDSRGKYISAELPKTQVTEEGWRRTFQWRAYTMAWAACCVSCPERVSGSDPQEIAGRFRRDFDFAVVHAVKQEMGMESA